MGELVQLNTKSVTTGAYLALPDEGRGPGVLLLHAWWGLTGFFKGLADRLANEGFVILAPDLYGGMQTAETIADAEKLSDSLSTRDGLQRALGAVDHLLSHPAVRGDKIGVIGFSLGAAFAEMASEAMPEVAAVVLFYGGADILYYDEGFADLTNATAFMGHFAEHDQYEPTEAVPVLEEKLRAAGKEATFYVYTGTGHWFFEDNRPDAYSPQAARLALQRTIDFLHDKLGW